MLDAWIIEKIKEEANKRPEVQAIIDNIPEVELPQAEQPPKSNVIEIDILCHSLLGQN